MSLSNSKSRTPLKRLQMFVGFGVCYLLVFSFPLTVFSQMKISGASGRTVTTKKSSKKALVPQANANRSKSSPSGEDGEREAERMDLAPAVVQKTTAEIMAEQAARGTYTPARAYFREHGIKRPKKTLPDRRNLPQALARFPNSNRFPLPEGDDNPLLRAPDPDAPQIAAQTTGPSFNAVTGPTETGAFPPDTEAEVGPNSIAVFLNGRLRTFNKGTSAVAPTADGVLNVDTDVFFASVMTPPAAGEIVFTTDPNVRYDRISNRWFLNMIDVPLNSSTGATTRANRVLLAVSDAASNGNITASTVWTFYQFLGDATLFTDYQSFGIDAGAIYIGANMFTTAGAFNSTKGIVIPKAPLLTGSPATVWSFSGLVATSSSAGPFSPRGVDNPDPANTGPTAIGYFIGVDNATFNTLMLRRVTNPGSTGAAPTISANISIALPLTTRFPLTVNHLGDTGGTNGNLDGLDDRLMQAMMRNGRLWTAHSIGVNNTGVAGATNNRNAARWYELQNLNATPSVVQSGTLYDNNATNDANQRNYWIPTIAVSGQGHAILGTSIAGTNERINAFVTGRQSGDALGTMREGPGGASIPGYTASSTAYNPPGDPGPPRRWGDYSATVVDPLDDMTMWTFQEYCNGTNTYGVRGVRLIAPPPPAVLTPSPASTAAGQASVNIVVTGVQSNGSAFYDPGTNLAAPALPFNHITASITPSLAPEALMVNSVTYNSPTQVTINLNTTGATTGAKTLTITNPDGQTTSTTVTILPGPTAAHVTAGGRVLSAAGYGIANATVFVMTETGQRRSAITNAFGHFRFDNLLAGQTYVFTVTAKRYTFGNPSQVVSLSEDRNDLIFIAD